MYHIVKVNNLELHLESLKTHQVKEVSFTNAEAELLLNHIIDMCASSDTRKSSVSRALILAHIYLLSYISSADEKETFSNIITTFNNKQYAECLKFFIVDYKTFFEDVYMLCRHLCLSLEEVNNLHYWEFKTLANITKKEHYERRRKDREDLDRD